MEISLIVNVHLEQDELEVVDRLLEQAKTIPTEFACHAAVVIMKSEE